MNQIDKYKAMLHNTMLYTKGYDFDSTKKMGGLYDLLEQLRPYVIGYEKIVQIVNNREQSTPSLCISQIESIINGNDL